MRHLWIPSGLILVLLSACASESSVKSLEYLDERTAMTVGSLKEPIELVPSLHQQVSGLHVLGSLVGKKVSFAYLGPVEWDRSGALAYGLWIHIAPGNDRPIADIRSPKALTLVLDGGTRVLNPIDAPQLGRGAYEATASWGQTAYFELTVEMLKQMAASKTMELDVRAADDSIVNFIASSGTRETLTDYLHSRGITND
jgi:hypothetical protein